MKVSFLVSDVNSPVLGPVTVLARHLQSEFDVEVVGPDLGYGVNVMYRDAFSYTVVPCPHIYRFPEYFSERRRLAEALTGDVIIPVKAVGNTIPVALMLKRSRGVKVVPYLDEWDGALMAQRTRSERIRYWLKNAHHPLEDNYYPWVEKLIPKCDSLISTSTFLQRRFGGHIVPMGVDCEFFKPTSEEETRALKRKLGIEGKRLIVFGGVVRPHKGIETIPQAVARSGVKDLRFVIVGPINEHVRELLADPELGEVIVTAGPQSHHKMPAFLSLADLIVLPLQDTLLAQSQVPCKIFEAMAMSRPIIASDVSDMATILDDSGWVVPSGDVAALAEQIREVFANPDEAKRRGEKARERCIAHYSSEVTRRSLVSLIRGIMG